MAGTVIAALFWIGLAATFVAGLRFTRRQRIAAELEEGRRAYPCSHGSAPRPPR